MTFESDEQFSEGLEKFYWMFIRNYTYNLEKYIIIKHLFIFTAFRDRIWLATGLCFVL